MSEKIIFLDIDGPMIPGTRYLHNTKCSFERDFCPNCVMVLRKMIDESGAKIVFNSHHNTELDDLVEKMTAAGFGDDIHPTRSTVFPYGIDESSEEYGSIQTYGDRRLLAVKMWLREHWTDQMLWVIIDDEDIEHKRAIRVDFSAGMTLHTYNTAARMLMYKPFWVM